MFRKTVNKNGLIGFERYLVATTFKTINFLFIGKTASRRNQRSVLLELFFVKQRIKFTTSEYKPGLHNQHYDE